MKQVDIEFLLQAPNPDEGWLLTVADDIMDYLTGAGHEVVATTNTVRNEIGIELSSFGGDVDEPEALRIAMELLATAVTNAGAQIVWVEQPKRWPSKPDKHTLTRRSTRISA